MKKELTLDFDIQAQPDDALDHVLHVVGRRSLFHDYDHVTVSLAKKM